jgi:hypothetical protein
MLVTFWKQVNENNTMISLIIKDLKNIFVAFLGAKCDDVYFFELLFNEVKYFLKKKQRKQSNDICEL